MASLGVLSKRYREAAIKLLEKSLNFKFPEKQETSYQAKYIDELNRADEEAKKRDEEYKKHIEECEALGYDMSAYKEDEPIGGAYKAGEAAITGEKAALQHGDGVQGKWASGNQTGQYMGDCTHDCRHCTRKHCINRKNC